MSSHASPKRNGPEIRRALILEEAIQTISERGYFGFRIQDLAQRCGLTNGGVLYHFASKEELLLAVLDERERREVIAVREATGIDPLERGDRPLTLPEVKLVLRAIVVRGAEQPEIVRLLHVLNAEALHEGHPAHGYFIDRETRVLSAFADMIRPFTPSPEHMARKILALAYGLEMQWLRSGCTIDLADEWDRALTEVLASAHDHGDLGASV
ncbi:MAG: TetR/AcrR family transcriptional regulator [Novosphingobium sp.]